MKFDLKANMTKEDTRGKYIFWDIDGTLAPYRFNGHVASPDQNDEHAMSRKEAEAGIFRTRLPSKLMQHIVESCEAKQQIIMGHYFGEQEIEDKNFWLDKYFPQIKERIFIDRETPKYDAIIDYCNQRGISLSDVVFVDDVHKYIRDAERHGIKSFHISSLMDWDYQEE